MNTVAQGRSYIADAVKGGSSVSSTAVLRELNRAQQELLANNDLVDLTMQRMRFHATRNMIACPSYVESVVGYKTDDMPGVVPKSLFYEFLPSGSGSSDAVSGYMSDMVDAGDHKPTMFEMDVEYTPMYLYAFCSDAADVGATIFVDGYDNNGWRNLTAGEYGQNVTLVAGLSGTTVTADAATWQPSASQFSQIINVVKPVTKGYVALMCRDATNGYWWTLSVYAPKETNPSYHRYKLALPRDTEGTTVIALVKLRHVPLVADTDIMLVQNLEAIRLQVLANQYQQSNPSQSEFYRQAAIARLRRDVANKTPDQDVCLDETFCVGTIVSR